jgi:hypothetical protein
MKFTVKTGVDIVFAPKKQNAIPAINKGVMAILKKVSKIGKMSVYGRDWFNGLIPLQN